MEKEYDHTRIVLGKGPGGGVYSGKGLEQELYKDASARQALMLQQREFCRHRPHKSQCWGLSNKVLVLLSDSSVNLKTSFSVFSVLCDSIHSASSVACK